MSSKQYKHHKMHVDEMNSGLYENCPFCLRNTGKLVKLQVRATYKNRQEEHCTECGFGQVRYK
jgi:uncharacterized protein (DUF983 family)